MKYIKIIVTTIITIILFILLNKLLKPKYMTNLVEGNMTYEYYQTEKINDVIFIGDCEVYANFSPIVMYEENGITAYVRGNSQQLIWQSYYLLKETLNYEIPKVVVFNVNSMRHDEPVSEAYNHLMIDKMKWSKEKIDLINASMLENESFIYYTLPILRYHSRIFELTKEDIDYLFTEKINTHNGFLINTNVKGVTSLPVKKELPTYQFSESNYEYLEMIYDLCKENNIELVLIKAPSVYPYWYDEYENQIINFANEHNINFYNFLNVADEIGIDYQTDTYDGGLHMNLDGATKLSKYFSNILSTEYNLEDHRLDEKISKIYNNKINSYYKEIEEKRK